MRKKCGCCGAVYTAQTWAQLVYVGIQSGQWELRNCSCGSTLLVPLAVVKEAA